MRILASSVLWRYMALAVQLLVVLLVARQTDIDVAAKYFSLFGLVVVTSVGAGLGAPDGSVRLLPLATESQRSAESLDIVRAVVRVSAYTSCLGTLCMIVLLVITGSTWTQAGLGGAWWLGYAATFVLAQLITGLGSASAGAFAAYSAVNFCYLATVVPYLILAKEPDLTGLLLSAAVASTVSSMIVGRLAWRALRKATAPAPDSVAEVDSLDGSRPEHIPALLLRTGFPMLVCRLLQASLPWIPVWALAAWSNSDAAANYATASRLIMAVAAVIAALRFAVRPRIVVLFQAGRFGEIGRLSRLCSVLAVLPLCGVVCALLLGGRNAAENVFGDEYGLVFPLLVILLAGVAAEALGGISDEILKMTGSTYVVVASLAAAVSVQLLAGLIVADQSAKILAIATVIAFAVQYVVQLAWIARHTQINIWWTQKAVPA